MSLHKTKKEALANGKKMLKMLTAGNVGEDSWADEDGWKAVAEQSVFQDGKWYSRLELDLGVGQNMPRRDRAGKVTEKWESLKATISSVGADEPAAAYWCKFPCPDANGGLQYASGYGSSPRKALTEAVDHVDRVKAVADDILSRWIWKSARKDKLVCR